MPLTDHHFQVLCYNLGGVIVLTQPNSISFARVLPGRIARLADTDFAEKISSWGQVGESSGPQSECCWNGLTKEY